jgi:SAM-dependent methyltransferase
MKREEELKKAVRQGYGQIARQEQCSCCGPSPCCGGTDLAGEIGRKIGYGEEEMASVPDGANLGLGCGNPVALASLRPGETVLDLGSGAGFDCFLAAKRVGEDGRVIGVDMTPEMVARARENAEKGGYRTVEFRLGEIEHLPVERDSVDAIISNCVINLVPDKRKAFAEAFRVLRPGGRLMVSDIVLVGQLPERVRRSVGAYVGCLSGAVEKEAYLGAIRDGGFSEITVHEETEFPLDCMVNDGSVSAVLGDLRIGGRDLQAIGEAVRSVKVSALKKR